MIDALFIKDDPSLIRESLLNSKEQNIPFHHMARTAGTEELHEIAFFIERIILASEGGELDDNPYTPVYIAVGRVAIDNSKETLRAVITLHLEPNDITPPAVIEVSDIESW